VEEICSRVLYSSWFTMENLAPKFTHTAIDDLESFLWVLFWVTLDRQRMQKGRLPQPELHWWTKLNSDNIMLQSAKDSLINNSKVSARLAREPIKQVAPLLLAWENLAQQAREEVVTALADNPGSLTFETQRKCYEKYLDARFTFLKDASKSWED
jgi:hypothetical protein